MDPITKELFKAFLMECYLEIKYECPDSMFPSLDALVKHSELILAESEGCCTLTISEPEPSRMCDICDQTVFTDHRDVVSGRPRHPHCIPY